MLEHEFDGNHSLYAYLSRRETNVLMDLLQFYLQQEISAYHCGLIQDILTILTERGEEISEWIAMYKQRYVL